MTQSLANVLLRHGLTPEGAPKEEVDRFTSDNMEALSTQCEGCKHMLVRNTTCTAYPEGIPNSIISGAVDHSTPYMGDNGIVFEPN